MNSTFDHNWWLSLETQWQRAFGEVYFGHFQTPGPEELEKIAELSVLRFAGPQAPFPNMSFELDNLSGLIQLNKLEILVVTYHQLTSLTGLENKKALKGLFVNNNRIVSLDPISQLVQLEQLHVQANHIQSLQPLSNLTGLKSLYVSRNELVSLEGIREAHADHLEQFVCMPNTGIRQKECLQLERNLGIRCYQH